MSTESKPNLEWEVSIREVDGTLVRVAEVDTEGRAALMAGALKDVGIPAIYYKPEVKY